MIGEPLRLPFSCPVPDENVMAKTSSNRRATATRARPPNINDLDLSGLPTAQLWELRNKVLAQIKSNMLEDAETYRNEIGSTYLVHWTVDGGYYAAEICEILDSGVVKVRWSEDQEGYEPYAFVSANCIIRKLDPRTLAPIKATTIHS